MDPLTASETRVLGALLEKAVTTPDQYPLSTNALVNACNQKSNREPVVEFSESETVAAMLLVRQNGLARTNASGRADKHRHILGDALGLTDDQLAVLAVMMLRGPQSTGELKTRTERYPTSNGTGFDTLDEIEVVATVDGQNVQDIALSAAENLMTANPDMNAIYATGEPALLGAIAAVESQGRQDDITVFGWDLTAQAIDGIDAGYVEAVVQQSPSGMGAAVVEALVALTDGGDVERQVDVPITIVTTDNVDEIGRASCRERV